MAKAPPFLVIPAAGLGTRMKSLNHNLPKEMLAIGGKPAIQYTVEEGIDAAIERIVIIINRGKETIRQHCSRLPCSLTFLYQEEPRGEADAIALAEDVTGEHALAIFYPDNLYLPAPGALKRLVQVFHRYQQDIVALSAVTNQDAAGIGNSGHVDISQRDNHLYRIERFHPKGPSRFRLRFEGELRACGIMIAGPHIFDLIRCARERWHSAELTDEPVRRLLLEERGLLGLRLPGTVYDVGIPAGYRLCVEQLRGRVAAPARPGVA